MAAIIDYLTQGGIPDGWTRQNLAWLAQAHWRLALGPNQNPDSERAAWHQRWATLIEDLLETPRVHDH